MEDTKPFLLQAISRICLLFLFAVGFLPWVLMPDDSSDFALWVNGYLSFLCVAPCLVYARKQGFFGEVPTDSRKPPLAKKLLLFSLYGGGGLYVAAFLFIELANVDGWGGLAVGLVVLGLLGLAFCLAFILGVGAFFYQLYHNSWHAGLTAAALLQHVFFFGVWLLFVA